MLKHIRIGLAIFVVSLLVRELLCSSYSLSRWLMGKLAWGPAVCQQTAPDAYSSTFGIFPVFLLFPFLYLLIVGFINLFELN
jgi:hypothetical protein